METALINAKDIMLRLAKLQADMSFIREHIEDITLTEDDAESLKQAEREFKERKTIPHTKLKKELGL
ncbi:hypothetical protein HYV89_00860 [Candidatus Woesearchaeota archaeon]|nr:hypothetical protein [Candidatus Woesearchaeota archaeon]